MCGVRGIGVAESASTSTSSRSWRSSSFCATPKLLLVEDDETEVHSGSRRARAHDASRSGRPRPLAFAKVREHALGLGRAPEPRDHLDAHGKSLYRSRNVFQCCSARMVVGASINVCLPLTATAKAARMRPRSCRTRRRRRQAGPSGARLEILLDRFDRALLILRLAVRELGLEPLEPLVVEQYRQASAPAGARRRGGSGRPRARARLRARAP